MESRKASFRLPEFTLTVSLAVVAALVGWGLASGWWIALVPGLAYALAATAAYALSRLESKKLAPGAVAQASRVQVPPARSAPGAPAVVGAAAFHIVGARGTCLLGRRVGEVVLVPPGGRASLPICPAAEVVLQLAASGSAQGVKEWCCPIYDHFLVFKQEPQPLGSGKGNL